MVLFYILQIGQAKTLIYEINSKDIELKEKGLQGDATMTRGDDLRKLAKSCAKVLHDTYGAKKVFLIGSAARGDVHERSDIDIAVEGLKPHLYIKALTELYDLLEPGIELNLIPLEDAYETLKEKARQEGVVLYG